MKPQRYDHLARVYRSLEHALFGRALERARELHLDALADARRVLVVGEGDGRFLARLLSTNAGCSVDVVEHSMGMIEAMRRRLGPAALERVHLIRADARSYGLSVGAYDAIVTHFFFDILEREEIVALLPRLAASLRPGGLWAIADFYLPSRGAARLRSRLWLDLLYWFFGWQAGVSTRELVDVTPLLESQGMALVRDRYLRGRLLRSQLFAKPHGVGDPCPET